MPNTMYIPSQLELWTNTRDRWEEKLKAMTQDTVSAGDQASLPVPVESEYDPEEVIEDKIDERCSETDSVQVRVTAFKCQAYQAAREEQCVLQLCVHGRAQSVPHYRAILFTV